MTINENMIVEPYTLVLAKRNYKHIGVLSNVSELTFKKNMNSADEVSFKITKTVDGYTEPNWNDITDLRLIYVKEENEYFQMEVQTDDGENTTKSITGTSLCEAELSQVLVSMEINTENDIARGTNGVDTEYPYDPNMPTIFYRNPDDYKEETYVNIFEQSPDIYNVYYYIIDEETNKIIYTDEHYNKLEDQTKRVTNQSAQDEKRKKMIEKASLVHRIMYKTPHYSFNFDEIDESLKNYNEVKNFSVSDQALYDFMTGDIAEAFNCIFIFNSIDRTIEAHDLYTYCKDCNNRGDFNDVCDREYMPMYFLKTDTFHTTESVDILDPLNNSNKVDLKDSKYVDYSDGIYTLKYDIELAVISFHMYVELTKPDGTTVIYNTTKPELDSTTGQMPGIIMAGTQFKSLYLKTDKNVYTFNVTLRIDVVCGSTNLAYYGDDTTIFITPENLTDSISYTTDVGSIKNTFKLKGGDDEMTAAIANATPTRSGYLYYFPDETKEDMSDELKKIWADYNEAIEKERPEYDSYLRQWYDASYWYYYYKDSMMPSSDDYLTETASITAETEKKAIDEEYEKTDSNLKTIGISDIEGYVSADGGIVSYLNTYIKGFCKTAYIKVRVDTTTEGKTPSWLEDSVQTDSSGNKYRTWCGRYRLVAYSDEKEEKVFYTEDLQLVLTEEIGAFTKHNIITSLIGANPDGKYADVYNMLDSSWDLSTTEGEEKYTAALGEYCLSRLDSFKTSVDAVLSTMQSTKISSLDTDLQTKYQKMQELISAEIIVRTETVDEWYASYTNLTTEINTISASLDMESYFKEHSEIGESLYKEFCSFKREDVYDNSNYSGADLDEAELQSQANKFLEVAEKDIQKSAYYQHSISANLYNLMLIPEFKPLLEHFKIGNWLRLKVDGKIYRLRLISYTIDFDNLSTISVEFSTVTQTANGYNDMKSILSAASSMASSYSSTEQQVQQMAATAIPVINEMLNNGLNSALVTIKNNENEEVIMNNEGIYARVKDDSKDSGYDDKQLRITHNILCFTDDNWTTASLALGEHQYTKYDGTSDSYIIDTGYGLSSKFVESGYIHGAEIIAGKQYSENYSSVDKTGSYFNWNDGTFSIGNNQINFDGTNLVFGKDVKITYNSGTTTTLNQLVVDADAASSKAQAAAESASSAASSASSSASSASESAKSAANAQIDTVKYGTSSDSSTTPTTWYDSPPTGTPPYYVWCKITYKNSNVVYSKTYIAKDGGQGDQGVSVSSITTYYLNTTSDTTSVSFDKDNPTSGGWSTSCPTYDENKPKYWTVILTIWSDKTRTATTPTSDNGLTVGMAYSKSLDRIADEKWTNYLTGGGGTLIDDKYVISPYLAGGYLNIASDNYRVVINPKGTAYIEGGDFTETPLFGVYKTTSDATTMIMGVDKNGNASFSGSVTATSGYIGGTNGWIINSTSLYNGYHPTSASDKTGIYIGTQYNSLSKSYYPTIISYQPATGGDTAKTTTITNGGIDTNYIRAIGGDIGGFYITSNDLYKYDSDNNRSIYISSTSDELINFGIKVSQLKETSQGGYYESIKNEIKTTGITLSNYSDYNTLASQVNIGLFNTNYYGIHIVSGGKNSIILGNQISSPIFYEDGIALVNKYQTILNQASNISENLSIGALGYQTFTINCKVSETSVTPKSICGWQIVNTTSSGKAAYCIPFQLYISGTQIMGALSNMNSSAAASVTITVYYTY